MPLHPEAVLQRPGELLIGGVEQVLICDAIIDAHLVAQLRHDRIDHRRQLLVIRRDAEVGQPDGMAVGIRPEARP